MKTFLAVSAAVLLCCLAAASAHGQGDFALVWLEAQQADLGAMVGRYGDPALRGQPAEVKAVPKGLSDKVRYFAIPVGDRKILAILDGSPPWKLHVDAGGTGDLSTAPPLLAKTAALTRGGGQTQAGWMFGPLSMAAGGPKGAAAKVRFRVYQGQENRLVMEPAGYMAGEVRLAGPSYRVRLLDANLDGRFDGVLDVSTMAERLPPHDRIAIDLDQDGEFKGNEVLSLTKMIRVGDTYYGIRVAPDGSSVHLEKVQPKTGTLDVGCADATVEVMSDAGRQVLGGSSGKWPVPAGPYCLSTVQLLRTDASGVKWAMKAGPWHLLAPSKLAAFEVRPGQTFAPKVGPPLVAVVSARKYGSAPQEPIHITFFFQGAAGEEYRNPVLRDDRPLWPIFEILDEAGKVLHEGTFQQPLGPPCSARWRAPDGFKGKYRVKVTADTGPFELQKGPDPWFTVE